MRAAPPQRPEPRQVAGRAELADHRGPLPRRVHGLTDELEQLRLGSRLLVCLLPPLLLATASGSALAFLLPAGLVRGSGVPGLAAPGPFARSGSTGFALRAVGLPFFERANASCVNLAGGAECVCNAGFSGDGVACADLDECAAGTDNCSDRTPRRPRLGHHDPGARPR